MKREAVLFCYCYCERKEKSDLIGYIYGSELIVVM